MPGGLIQLISYGAQDIYLTGSPQITYFKNVYRKYTNFAMENSIVNFNETFSFNSELTITLPRNGDLIGQISLIIDIPDVTSSAISTKGGAYRWISYLGHNIIKECSIYYNDYLIDKVDGHWLNVWNEIIGNKLSGYQDMIGNKTEWYKIDTTYKKPGTSGSISKYKDTIIIPIPFSSSQPGLSILIFL